jgi:serine/threonine protein kinase
MFRYVLLVGYPPFMEDNQHELFRKIRAGEYDFPEEDWGGISDEAKDLIQKLLKVDPLERLTAGGALRHKWMLEADDSLSSRDLSSSLKAFKQRKGRLKSIAKAVMWFSKDRPSEPTFVENHSPRPVAEEEGSTESVSSVTEIV